MKSYSVDWFEGNGALKPGIPSGSLPELMSAHFDDESTALSHARQLIASGRRAVTLRGPGGLVVREAEIEADRAS
jgi:hypothetical protein